MAVYEPGSWTHWNEKMQEAAEHGENIYLIKTFLKFLAKDEDEMLKKTEDLEREMPSLDALFDKGIMPFTSYTIVEVKKVKDYLEKGWEISRKEKETQMGIFSRAFNSAVRKCEESYAKNEDIQVCISGANKMLDTLNTVERI